MSLVVFTIAFLCYKGFYIPKQNNGFRVSKGSQLVFIGKYTDAQPSKQKLRWLTVDAKISVTKIGTLLFPFSYL